MLEAIGGSISAQPRQCCRDICTPTALTGSTLDLLRPGVTKRKRKRVAREFTSEALETLKTSLINERNAVMIENPGFLMIGPDLLYFVRIQINWCNEDKSIKDIDDLTVYGLRKELKERFFNLIVELSTVLHVPPPASKFCN